MTTNNEAYRAELERLGYNTRKIHPTAYRATLQRITGVRNENPRDLADFMSRFPDACRLAKDY